MRFANDNVEPCRNCGRADWVEEPDGLGIKRQVCTGCGDSPNSGLWLTVFLASAAGVAIVGFRWAVLS
jgi:hypothetical protein